MTLFEGYYGRAGQYFFVSCQMLKSYHQSWTGLQCNTQGMKFRCVNKSKGVQFEGRNAYFISRKTPYQTHLPHRNWLPTIIYSFKYNPDVPKRSLLLLP